MRADQHVRTSDGAEEVRTVVHTTVYGPTRSQRPRARPYVYQAEYVLRLVEALVGSGKN